MNDEQRDWTPALVLKHIIALIAASDKRYEDRFDAQEKAVHAALTAAKEAVSVAEINAEKWRANANEWRSAMSDREARFVGQAEFLALKERIDKQDGAHSGIRDLWGWMTAGVMAIIAAIGLYFRR